MHGPELRLSVHPLCIAVGIASACTGSLLLFLSAILAALEHECAHAFAARRCGFVLDKIVLMPYGAVVKGELSGISRRKELGVLLAGPLANGATGLAFVALWWLYPETYPYTDVAALVSFSLFFVNLLPAWPLDGGRILRLLLRPLGERRAKIICRILTLSIAFGVLGYFIFSCFSEPAWTALTFSALLVAGAFGGGEYRRVSFSREKDFARGIEEYRVAVSARMPLADAVSFLREDRYLTLLLFDGKDFFAEMTEEEFLSALEQGDYSKPLAAFCT